MDVKPPSPAAPPVKLLENEYWWGGIVRHGTDMPYSAAKPYTGDLYNLVGNQGCPVLVSSKGRYIWSDEPFVFEFAAGAIKFSNAITPIQISEGHGNLRSAYLAAGKDHFAPSGKTPDEVCFTAPQYNAWIDMMWDVTQEKVLRYAQDILAGGMPPGVLMIDDNWYLHNGGWVFHPHRFSDPKGMVDQLHKLGFKVVVWVTPFICAETYQYRILSDAGLLLKDGKGKTRVFEWWNGFSALLDLTNPAAAKVLTDSLDTLIETTGVDGFKFDGGDPYYYTGDVHSLHPRTANAHCEDFGRVGLRYGISEYRACWKLGGEHLIQRIRDKRHEWGEDAFGDVIHSAIAQGLMGYPFTCPDMVGGGQVGSFYYKKLPFDAELFLRWAQCATFFPVIQYSLLPSRVLKGKELEICMATLQLRKKHTPRLLELVRHAAKTGEPILRHMAYVFPDEGLELVGDQYMFGDEILVAPVMQQGARSRTVRLPKGKWRGDDGSVVSGPCQITIEAPLSRLPFYTKVAQAF